jgi:CubicO group peptidase (beta-lactamase class C family)
MDSVRLAEGIDLLIANRELYRVHSVVVVRNGSVVLDARFYPFAGGERHDLASVTKSFTSTLVGIAIDKGYISSVDAHMLDFFPGRVVANLDQRKRAVTVKHLLAMRSGLRCDPGGFEQTLTEMTQSPDWVQFALDLPMAEDPGQTDVYCSPGVHLLSAILQQATGMSALEFGRRHLFGPLGVANVQWPADPQGVNRGWGDLALEPKDVAKLGVLFLNGGTLFGRRVVSPAWVDSATSIPEGYEYPGWPEGAGRGYLWWLASDGYSAAGRGGQLVSVYPDEGLVVGLTGGGCTGDCQSLRLQFLNDFVRAVVSGGAFSPTRRRRRARREGRRGGGRS